MNISIEQFRVDHRAWVSLGDIKFIRYVPDGIPQEVTLPEFKPGDIINLNVVYKNTGNTPAFNVCERSFAGTLTLMNPSFPPVDPKFKPINTLKGCRPSIIMPGTVNYESLGWQGLSSTDLLLIRVEKKIIYVHGRMDYRDAFNVNHWTKFCRFLTAGGGWGICKNGDQVDNNPEIPAPSKKTPN